ncbi:MAG: hypothetical protein ABIC91_02570 [Nanoarchaeota archaeon]|nr:hypothetical protein [Nanoarchaeota archaeon]MBU1850062.1 hypothetical protein [Nanoarchaeota archaeon]
MIGRNIDTEIISIFAENITEFLSILQIAKKLNKPYSYIHKKINEFLKLEILKKIVLGRAHLCTINLQSEDAVLLLSMYELEKKKSLLKKNNSLEKKMASLNKIKTEALMLTAIYHENKILILTNNQPDKKKLHNKIKKLLGNFEVFTKEEFQQELIKKPTLLYNHTLLYQYEKYYEIVGEIEQELKIRNSLLIT